MFAEHLYLQQSANTKPQVFSDLRIDKSILLFYMLYDIMYKILTIFESSKYQS